MNLMKLYMIETSFIKTLIIKYTNIQDERFSKTILMLLKIYNL